MLDGQGGAEVIGTVGGTPSGRTYLVGCLTRVEPSIHEGVLPISAPTTVPPRTLPLWELGLKPDTVTKPSGRPLRYGLGDDIAEDLLKRFGRLATIASPPLCHCAQAPLCPLPSRSAQTGAAPHVLQLP